MDKYDTDQLTSITLLLSLSGRSDCFLSLWGFFHILSLVFWHPSSKLCHDWLSHWRGTPQLRVSCPCWMLSCSYFPLTVSLSGRSYCFLSLCVCFLHTKPRFLTPILQAVPWLVMPLKGHRFLTPILQAVPWLVMPLKGHSSPLCAECCLALTSPWLCFRRVLKYCLALYFDRFSGECWNTVLLFTLTIFQVSAEILSCSYFDPVSGECWNAVLILLWPCFRWVLKCCLALTLTLF